MYHFCKHHLFLFPLHSVESLDPGDGDGNGETAIPGLRLLKVAPLTESLADVEKDVEKNVEQDVEQDVEKDAEQDVFKG